MEVESLPLFGFRVVDLTMVIAGPFCTRLLADLGAEVIKVEACRKPDGYRGGTRPVTGSRFYPNGVPGAKPWHRHAYFNTLNRNKLGITLDLTIPAGVALLADLVKVADILVENYSARVMGQLGLSWEVLKKINPGLIYCSMPGFGLSGPYRDYVAYGTTVEAMSGLTSLIGYSGGPPMHSGLAYGDPVAGISAANGILTALFQREHTGEGRVVEVAQVETAACQIGEVFLDYFMNGRIPARLGNRDASRTPQDCFPTKGDDQWVTITVESDEQWRRLCTAIGRQELAEDRRYADGIGRWHHADEIDAVIREWTAQRGHYEVMTVLQEAGLAAGPVLSAAELLEDPQLQARQFFETMDQPEVGTHPYPTHPIHSSRPLSPVIRHHAPRLGEDNQDILGGLLGLSDDQIEALRREGVIGTEPID